MSRVIIKDVLTDCWTLMPKAGLENLGPVEKYLLGLLFAPDSSGKYAAPIKGNTWLQKEMQVLSTLRPNLEEDAEYDAHAMGAFSETVEVVADQFRVSGFTEKVGSSAKLTLEGKQIAEAIWNDFTNREKQLVTNVKTWLNDLSYYELLGLVYTEFPETAKVSQVVPAVDARRIDVGISLFHKGKVPLSLAHRIARVSESEFLNLLARRGVSSPEAETAQIKTDAQLLQEIERSRADSEKRRLVSWELIEKSQ